jgi:hypothetical protein
MRLGSAHFGSNAPVSWGSETAYDLAPLPSGAGTVPRSKHRGPAALVSRAETLLKTPSTWFESLSGKAEPGTASPGLLQNVFAWDQFPRARQSRCSLKMLVRSRANAPRFLGAFLRTESGGRSGFDPVDLSSKPLDSFDPVVDLGESSAGRDRNPSGPGRLSVRNPPQAAVARPPWPGRRGQAAVARPPWPGRRGQAAVARRWRAAKDLLRGVFVASRSGADCRLDTIVAKSTMSRGSPFAVDGGGAARAPEGRTADQYTISDNYHQPAMGGTGLQQVFLGTGDDVFLSDGNGNPTVPPTAQIANPNPLPVTNNQYTADGRFSNCSDPVGSPGVLPIVRYLDSLGDELKAKLRQWSLLHAEQYKPRLSTEWSARYGGDVILDKPRFVKYNIAAIADRLSGLQAGAAS